MTFKIFKKKRRCGMCSKKTPEDQVSTIYYTAMDGPGEFPICDECRKEYLEVNQDV